MLLIFAAFFLPGYAAQGIRDRVRAADRPAHAAVHHHGDPAVPAHGLRGHRRRDNVPGAVGFCAVRGARCAAHRWCFFSAVLPWWRRSSSWCWPCPPDDVAHAVPRVPLGAPGRSPDPPGDPLRAHRGLPGGVLLSLLPPWPHGGDGRARFPLPWRPPPPCSAPATSTRDCWPLRSPRPSASSFPPRGCAGAAFTLWQLPTAPTTPLVLCLGLVMPHALPGSGGHAYLLSQVKGPQSSLSKTILACHGACGPADILLQPEEARRGRGTGLPGVISGSAQDGRAGHPRDEM